MFRAVFYTQWKWARPIVLLGVLIAAYIPVEALRSMAYKTAGVYYIPSLYGSISSASTGYQLLALGVAVVVAISAWQADAQRQHVYSLSLPVPRWKFVLLRFGAGAALLGIVALAVGVFGGVAAALAPLPAMLHAYPAGLAVRFWLGALIPFGLIFALLASNPRRVRVVVIAIATLVAVDFLLAAFGVTQTTEMTHWLWDALYSSSGPLAAFLSKWMLIDV